MGRKNRIHTRYATRTVVKGVIPLVTVLRSNGGRPDIRYERICEIRDCTTGEVLAGPYSRADVINGVPERDEVVNGASGQLRGEGVAENTAPATTATAVGRRKKPGRGRRAASKAAEQPVCEQGDGDVPRPTAGRSTMAVVTIISSSPVREACRVVGVGGHIAAPAAIALASAPKKRRGRGRCLSGKAAEQLVGESGDGDTLMPAGRSMVDGVLIISSSPVPEENTAENENNKRNDMADAVTNTNTSLLSRGSARLEIHGHSFDVLADRVEGFEAVPQQVVCSYCPVMENCGTARDVAVVMGARKRGGGGGVGGGEETAAGEGGEGATEGEGRGRKRLCRESEDWDEGRGEVSDKEEGGVMRGGCERGGGGEDRCGGGG
ncbi:uncharacterized protein LAJ45_03632 [Morchella importuna]|uniref:uncharacterized protein n=1 Tax=Morchella importuna TaxID=1174673 RepID=UPI001E8D1CEA|nr:uncharacterized protein LAJ45_03632 [Morchella importuna]KAH8152206.1 hypothetical protein LAJ45_03632 [Morchella importuna]